MIGVAALAILAGVLVSVSRQLNGRLSLSSTALQASFWNHAVGFGVLSLVAIAFGGLFTPENASAPLWAFLGGPLGVVFIASSSWLVTRIGAAQTAAMIIAGQMFSGVILDIILATPGATWARIVGVGLVLCGFFVARGKRQDRVTHRHGRKT
jgi:transporter family-2 protein